MFKKRSRPISRVSKHYWFTIVAANNQVLATSETYTTAAMRDKGIEAVKKVVWEIVSVKEAPKWAGEEAWGKSNITGKGSTYRTVGGQRLRHAPSDTFHIKNKKGKIVKG